MVGWEFFVEALLISRTHNAKHHRSKLAPDSLILPEQARLCRLRRQVPSTMLTLFDARLNLAHYSFNDTRSRIALIRCTHIHLPSTP